MLFNGGRLVGPALAGLILADVSEAWCFALNALSYFAIMIHRRILWYSVLMQMVQIAPLFFAAHLVELLVRLAAGGMFPGWSLLAAPLAEALLWPLAVTLLLAPQRRAPDPDKNRPL